MTVDVELGFRAGPHSPMFVGYRVGVACPVYQTVVGGLGVTERTSIGLDVHAHSVVATAIDGVTGEVWQTQLTPPHDHIRSWIADLPGPVAYEVGRTGFGLYRALSEAFIRCEIVAPSKLQRPSATDSAPGAVVEQRAVGPHFDRTGRIRRPSLAPGWTLAGRSGVARRLT